MGLRVLTPKYCEQCKRCHPYPLRWVKVQWELRQHCLTNPEQLRYPCRFHCLQKVLGAKSLWISWQTPSADPLLASWLQPPGLMHSEKHHFYLLLSSHSCPCLCFIIGVLFFIFPEMVVAAVKWMSAPQNWGRHHDICVHKPAKWHMPWAHHRFPRKSHHRI